MRSEGRRGFISREFVSEDLGVARQTFDSDLPAPDGGVTAGVDLQHLAR